MFKKKGCPDCRKKVNARDNFCSECGYKLSKKQKKEDWGMLGQADTTNEFNQFSNSLFGGAGGKIIGSMLSKTFKMLEKEMQKEMEVQNQGPKTNFELIINGEKIDPKNIRVSQQPMQKKAPKRKVLPNFSDESLKKISDLPKKEPTTEMKRLSDKIIYEIKMPGVKSLKDTSIIPLESSIEIKAIGRKAMYKKILPINLPIINYNLIDEKLILELGIRN